MGSFGSQASSYKVRTERIKCAFGKYNSGARCGCRTQASKALANSLLGPSEPFQTNCNDPSPLVTTWTSHSGWHSGMTAGDRHS